MSAPDDIKFYFFHHHHYLDIPPDEDRFTSTMVDYPNSIYDPEKGHALYQRHLRTVRLADELGFDGIAINEHHNMVYSMTPTVSVMAGAIVNATQQREDPGRGRPHQPRVPEPGGRGVRDARRHVGRPHGVRLPARDRHGVLGQRRERSTRRRPVLGSGSRSR